MGGKLHNVFENLWIVTGVIRNQVIGPHLFPDILKGEVFQQFLRNVLFEYLENRQRMILQNDGCPEHSRRTVRE